MKFYRRLGVYKNSTGSNRFNPKTMEAFSYEWWQYLKVFNGVLVFNGARYSSTTSGHQRTLRILLRNKNISYIEVDCIRGLQTIHSDEEFFKFKINQYKSERDELQRLIDHPSARKNKAYRLEKKMENLVEITSFINLWNKNLKS